MENSALWHYLYEKYKELWTFMNKCMLSLHKENSGGLWTKVLIIAI